MKRIMKRVVALLVAIMICGGSISWNAFITEAATIKYSGTDGDLTWSIDSEGHLLVEGTGDRENASATLPAWNEYWFEIKSATINVSEITDVNYFFGYCLYLTSVELSGLDTSNVTDMNLMFYCCESLTTLDLSSFNTTNVTNMSEMFYSCKLIQELDLSNFDMANVTSTSGMFHGCSSLASIKTPKNLNIDTDIPVDISYSWFLDDMTRMYMGLPIGKSESFVLNRVIAENSKQPDVGDGTVENPYEINESAELIWFAETVNSGNTGINGILTADIDINPGYTFASDGTFEKISETNHFTKWIPIGTDDATYTGVFEGQNHTIKGIYYDNFGWWSNTQDSQIGLFGEAGTSSIIRNITLDNGYISAKEKVGAICGNSAGSIEGCVNSVPVIGSDNYTGGLCGKSNGTITGCVNKAPVVSSGSYIGGVCGHCKNVADCINTATVLGNGETSSFVGGIVGEGKNVAKCYNVGSIKGAYEIGGIGGLVAYDGAFVSNNYNMGYVEASGESACAGGIIGLFDGRGSVLQNCFNAGAITNENSYNGDSGAIVGTPYGECVNNFYLADFETDSRDGTTSKTASQFASGEVAYLLQSAQIGTDIVWGQLIGQDAYPVLEGATVYNVENCCGGQYSNSNVSKAHNFSDGACVVCGEAEDVSLSGYSISLTGNIAVNFHIQMSEKVLNDSSAYMLFTFADGDTSKVKVSDAKLKTEDSETYYVLTCEVQAPEINDEFTAQIISTACETETYTYSVKTYADYILAHAEENGDYAKAAPMVRAMLNYGGYSQLQFKHNTDALANEGLYATNEDPVLTEDITLDDSYSFVAPNTDIGLRYYGSSLLLNAKTTIRHYFTITSNDDIVDICENYTFALDDNATLTPIMRGGMIYIDITGINAAELDDMFTLVVKNTETGKTISVTYSPFCYAKYVLENEIAGTNLMNVIKAMCLYNKAANNYYVANPHDTIKYNESYVSYDSFDDDNKEDNRIQELCFEDNTLCVSWTSWWSETPGTAGTQTISYKGQTYYGGDGGGEPYSCRFTDNEIIISDYEGNSVYFTLVVQQNGELRVISSNLDEYRVGSVFVLKK